MHQEDILIISDTEEQHLIDISNILAAFEKANLLLHPDKCQFGMGHGEILGLKFSSEGIHPSDQYLQAVKTFPRPTSVKETRAFLALTAFFHKHIKDRAIIAAPLFKLTKKNAIFQWTPKCQASFEDLKQALITAPVLRYPCFSQRFYLATDASVEAIGGVLYQMDPGGSGVHHAIGYCGRSLTAHEKNYSITKLELLGVVYSVTFFKTYLQGAPFTIYTDHSALTSILKTKSISPDIARLSLILQGYDFEVKFKAGKLNEAADALSRRTYNHTSDKASEFIEMFPDNQVLGIPDTSPEALCATSNLPTTTTYVPIMAHTTTETVQQRNLRKQHAGDKIEYIDMSQALNRLFSHNTTAVPDLIDLNMSRKSAKT